MTPLSITQRTNAPVVAKLTNAAKLKQLAIASGIKPPSAKPPSEYAEQLALLQSQFDSAITAGDYAVALTFDKLVKSYKSAVKTSGNGQLGHSNPVRTNAPVKLADGQTWGIVSANAPLFSGMHTAKTALINAYRRHLNADCNDWSQINAIDWSTKAKVSIVAIDGESSDGESIGQPTYLA